MMNSFPLVIAGNSLKLYQFGYSFGILLKKKYNFVPVKV